MSSYLNYYKHGGLLINPPNPVQVSNESFISKVIITTMRCCRDKKI